MKSLSRHPSHLLALAPRRWWAASAAGTRRRSVRPTLWSRVERALAGLASAGRRSVSIVDTDCGDGALLLRAAGRARALGLVAVDVVGFDSSVVNIASARAAAALRRADPAVGCRFDLRALGTPLPIEDGDADIIIVGPADLNPEILRIAGRQGHILRRG